MDNTSYPPFPQDTVQPQPPGYPPPAPSPAPPPNLDTGRSLVISALVIGAGSVLLCLIPFVNNLVFLTAPVGIGLAIPALAVSGRNKARARGLSLAGLLLSVLSLVGVIGTQAVTSSSLLNDVIRAVEKRSGAAAGSHEAEQPATAPEALALGTTAELGEYSVTVTAVDTDATDTVLAMDSYNEAPQGQYVLVDVTVTYNGAGEGDPWWDLRTKFIGADARQYDDRTCSARIDGDDHDVPTLEAGGVGEFQVCMDVPAEALADAEIFVEDGLSLDIDRVYWSIP